MSCFRAINRLDAVLKKEAEMRPMARRYSSHKEIRDTSAQLLIPQNDVPLEAPDEQSPPIAMRANDHRPIAASGSVPSMPTTTTSFVFENSELVYAAHPSAGSGLTAFDAIDNAIAFDTSAGTENANLFDMDIQSWPAWLTQEESPNLLWSNPHT